MLNDLQRKNISGVFDALDHDGDGVIARADLESLGRMNTDGLGLDPESGPGATVVKRYLEWWEEIRAGADADGDGAVSRDEYVAAVEQGLLTDPNYTNAVEAAGDALFDAADTDEDGYLSRDEFVRLYVVSGLPEHIASGAFDQIDTDGDGRISRVEMRASVRGAFTSTEPEMVGSNMLGNA